LGEYPDINTEDEENNKDKRNNKSVFASR